VIGVSAAGQARAATLTAPMPEATTGTPAGPATPSSATTGTPAAPASSSSATTGTPASSSSATTGTPASSSSATTGTAASSSSATAADSVVIPPRLATGTLSWVAPARKGRPVAAGAASVNAQWVNPLPAGVVTSCFGERWGRLHAGVDLATAEGTPILAAGAGVIVTAGPAEGYGNAVLIDHGDGFLTHYGHLSVITVRVGQHVRTGEQIGNEGSTGHSTGPHLHFEVHQGHYKNPIEPTGWMHRHGVDIPGCVLL
jgi:murein DD-endopeptidase MepM/ murein hydrolase activator NlpD